MMQKYNYEEWKKFINQLKNSKQQTQQFSKLYIIIHQKVRRTLHQCTINPQHNAHEQIKRHLEFIQDILIRFAHRNQDQYLSKINTNTLDKYQHHLYGLVYLLKATQEVQISKGKIDIKKLLSIPKLKLKQQYDLKNQLKKSNQRRIRSKSGQKIFPKTDRVQNQKQDQIHIQQNNNAFINQHQYIEKFLKKKQQLQKHINESIEKKGNQVYFNQKYQNIQKYIANRKEFQDLYFCQNFYDKILQSDQYQQDKVDQSIQKKNQNKLFPQFNIKTKFMKEKVKKNILNTLLSAKKQILKDIHLANLKKMKQINEAETIDLKIKKDKKYHKTMRIKQAQTKTLERERKISQTHFQSIKKNSMNILKLRSTSKSNFQTTWWTQDIEKEHQRHLVTKFQENKFQSQQSSKFP